MVEKPTYKEWDNDIKEMEKIFNFSIDMIGSGNLDGYFTKINPAFGKTLGYTQEEFLEKPFISFVHNEDVEKTEKALADAVNGKKELFLENRYMCKNGSYKWIEWKVLSIAQENKFFAVGREIAERKWAEESLNKANERLEEIVKERTAELEKKNTTLKVLLDQRRDDRKKFEETIMSNVKELLIPSLSRLKNNGLSSKQQTELNILESNLIKIFSPSANNLSLKHLQLTPTEIQVANLIKHGSSSKDIADHLGLSYRTIDTHRYNIRKKIGLSGKVINLRTHLSFLT